MHERVVSNVVSEFLICPLTDSKDELASLNCGKTFSPELDTLLSGSTREVNVRSSTKDKGRRNRTHDSDRDGDLAAEFDNQPDHSPDAERKKLEAAEVIGASDAENLRRAYNFLRAAESVLRRWQNRSVSKLPAMHEEEEMFARRMKFATIEDFRRPYGHAREVIHTLRLRYLVD